MTTKTRIVVEISRNWPNSANPLISQQFETVIAANRVLGYELESWQLAVTQTQGPATMLVETIIAVFVKDE